MQKVYLIIIVYLIGLSLNAQESNYSSLSTTDRLLSEMHFKHITTDDGLNSNNVSTIIQDRLGFLWFGTEEGLCRYDGNAFLSFVHSKTDTLSLCNNKISSIVEDDKGNFWIGTQRGLNYFNLSTYRFSRMPTHFIETIGSLPIKELFLSSNNILYITIATDGLYAYDLNNFSLTEYKNIPTDAATLINSNITGIAEDENQNLWLGTTNGLEMLDVKSQAFSHYFTGKSISVQGFNNDKQLVFTVEGDNSYHLKSIQDAVYKHIPVQEVNGNNKIELFIDSHKNKWISYRDNGLFFQGEDNEQSTFIRFNNENPNGINSNALTQIYEDREGNIWISTIDGGINFLDINRKEFSHINEQTHPGFENNRVRYIYQDSDNDIWIGSKMQGMLSQFSRNTNDFKHYKFNPEKKGALNDDYIFCIAEDRPGFLWIGTKDKGLSLFNKKTGVFSQSMFRFANYNMLNTGAICALLKPDINSLWIGTGYDGVVFYNQHTGRLKQYVHSDDPSSISDNRIRAIYKDSLENIWFGTSNGLNHYNSAKDTFIRYINVPGNAQSISGNEIICMHEDAKHRFWIGTSNGLNLFNREQKTFQAFTVEDGLPNNVICGILEDDQGNLWLSTNNGLSRFNPDLQTFRNYIKEDGLQGKEFAKYVYCKTANGELYFGGNNGFNYFDPENIIDNISVPEVCISGFKIFNREVLSGKENSPLQKHITQTREITLQHRQNSVTFSYVALNYSSPSKNEYKYLMDGFDKDWNFVKNKREAIYTNLDPGTYIFKVAASNNDGVWNEKGTQVVLTILPPPWLTWWAISLYIIVVVILVVASWIYSIKRVKEKKEREQNQKNLQFFINLSHEFRTPLTLILNPIAKLLNADGVENKEAVESISLSAHKLMNLVNQLLDFRKTDLGEQEINYIEGDMVVCTQKIFSLFKEVGESKGLKLNFKSAQSSVSACFDQDKLEKILGNLLSNAIKFTPKGGEIEVSISKVAVAQKKYFTGRTARQDFAELSVKDTGVGLSPKQKDHVFERFYSRDDHKTGTGIGLNYTKTLVEMLGGTISVESNEGQGSVFVVRLPIGSQKLISNISARQDEIQEGFQFESTHLESLRYDLASDDNETTKVAASDIEHNSDLPLVLVVEDNNQLRKQLNDVLKNDYRVKEAINGADGLELAQSLNPDLIISDIMMPVMDGIKMCKELKSDLNTSHIPLVLLTAKNLIENQIEGFETGADDYISKPFHMDVLLARINNLLVSRKRLKEKFLSSHAVLPAYEFTANKTDEKFLEEVTKIAINHISNPEFKANDIREMVNLSTTHFYDKIKSLTGQNPSNFLRTIRLQYAAELLQKKQGSIKEICYQAGFNSPSYFTKSFREQFGQTPLEYQGSSH